MSLSTTYSMIKDYFNAMGSDPRTASLPLVSNHLLVLGILAFYVVFARSIGPKLMSKRQPFELKTFIKFYNIIQVFLNAYIFFGLIDSYILHPKHNLSCTNLPQNEFSPKTIVQAKFTYYYFLSKMVDLIETVVFVLRKKYNQISHLHIYHHVLMAYGTYIHLSLTFGTQITFIAVPNSLVHVFMYVYYLLAAMEVNINLAAWKPRMTQMQITQLLIIIFVLSMPLTNNWCGVPIFWVALSVFQNVYLVVLFLNFYIKTYIMKKSKSQKSLN
ncbi:very long chain fatty acid elongase 7-like [Haematobia irritans]|uniref:very long chain fatty acid elongase 7-like n=1 Tax=Haematobia irritans TaxID=7368 RepID=UPI003F50CF7D